MTKVCKILVGLPGTGKSTYTMRNIVKNDEYASSDNIIEVIAEQHFMTYDQAFSDLIGFAEKVFWEELNYAAANDRSIWVDRTNLSVKSRKRVIDVFKNKGFIFEAIVFPIPVDWEARLAGRVGKTIPPHVLQDMKQRFQFPTMGEGFGKIEIYDEQLQNV